MRGKQRKQKVKFKTAVALLTPQKIVLSGYAQTSEADILHLEQKAGKCSSYKRRVRQFWLILARQ